MKSTRQGGPPPPTVSVIVPSRDRSDDLRRCLTGVYRQAGPAFEVIVVDDGSCDGTAEMVAREFPGARVLRFERSVGACSARNAALSQARGEYVWFLDSDSEPLTPDCLATLVGVVARDTTVGGVGGEMCAAVAPPPSGADQSHPCRDEQAAAAGVPHLGLLVRVKRIRINGETASVDLPLDAGMLAETDYLPTCNLLARRDLVRQLGGFDPVYIVLSEDKELGWGMRRCGQRSVICGAAPVLHHVSRRARRGDLFRKLRNTTRFALINLPWWRVVLLPLLDAACLLGRGKLRALKAGGISVTKHLGGKATGVVAGKRTPIAVKLLVVGPTYLGCLLAAYAWNLYHIVGTLRMRRRRPDFVEAARRLLAETRND